MDREHSVVLPLQSLPQLLLDDKADFAKAKVDDDQIREAECLLRDSIFGTWWHWSTEWDTTPPPPEELEAVIDDGGESFWHFRQYCGMTNAKGERLVFVNAFCHAEPTQRWRRNCVFVFDGYDCFWHAVVNLTTHRVESFELNGDA